MSHTLKELADLLQNLPTIFAWDYSTPCSCAHGLVEKIWPGTFPENAGFIASFEETFGLPRKEAKRIFWNLHKTIVDPLTGETGVFRKDVTPEHVAAAIDEWLSSAGRAPA